MLSKEKEEKLKYFLESVNQVAHPSVPGSSVYLYDIGLIIIEDDSSVTIEDVFSVFPKDKAKLLEYKDGIVESEFIEQVVNLLENKKWIFIELKKDLDHQLINQLRNFSENNIVQLLDYKGKEIYNLKLPPESRIVVIVKRSFLEKEISYPYFFNIFGPVISL